METVYTKEVVLEFSSSRKKMSTFVSKLGNKELLIKGGAEIILEEANKFIGSDEKIYELTNDMKKDIEKEI